MAKRKKYKFYFFDYLWWLGEKAQEYYQGQPNRPDGESIIMNYLVFCICLPLLGIIFYLDVRLSKYFLIVFSVFIFVWLFWLSKKIWPLHRQKAIMEYYNDKKFTPFRAYVALFFPITILLGTVIIWTNYHPKPKEPKFIQISQEEIIHLRQYLDIDTASSNSSKFNHHLELSSPSQKAMK